MLREGWKFPYVVAGFCASRRGARLFQQQSFACLLHFPTFRREITT